MTITTENEDKAKEWLSALTKSKKIAANREKQLKQKDAILMQLQQEIDSMSTKLLSNMDLIARKPNEDGSFDTGRKGKLDPKKEQQLLNFLLRDQTTEFDIDDQQDGFTLSDEDVHKHLEASRMVTELSKMLDYEVDELDEDGNPVKETIKVDEVDDEGRVITEEKEVEIFGPKGVKKVKMQVPKRGEKEVNKKRKLFSDEEISQSFYQPLVRQGLLPETFVPNKYSETHEMIEGGFGAYKQRLEKEGISNKFFNRDNFGTMLTFLSAGSSLTGSVSGILQGKAVKPEDLKDGIKWSSDWIDDLKKGTATEVMDTSVAAFEMLMVGEEAGEQIYDKVSEDEEEISLSSKRAKVAPRLAQFMLAVIGTSMSKKLADSDKQLAMSIAGAFSARVKPSTVAVHLAKSDIKEADIQAAAEVIKNGICDTFERCKLPSNDNKMAGIGSAAAEAFAIRFKDGKGETVQAILLALTDEKVGFENAVPPVSAAAESAFGEFSKEKQYLKANALAISSAAGKQIQDDFLKEQDENALKSKQELEELGNLDGEALKGPLEKRIAKLERDRLLLQWSTTLAGQGIAVVSKFFGPLAIAGSALNLALHIAEAAQRTIDFVNFRNSREDLFLAASPYSSPVSNFVYNSGIQMVHYEACAAIELVNMIGAIVETAGMASGIGAAVGVAAGKIIQAGAGAAAATESVIYELKKRYDIERAWATYKTALSRPENRKLALVAMQKNPTLAKYAVAWGAVIKKDPLVSDFMAKCGLDAETLRDPNSKLEVVVTYLETRMPDDSVIVGRDVAATSWEPSKIELTALCWTAAKRGAVQEAELIEQDTRKLEFYLSTFSTAFDKVIEEFKPDEKHVTFPKLNDVKQCIETLKSVRQEFGNYRPRRSVGGKDSIRHEQMHLVIGRFDQAIETHLKRLSKIGDVVEKFNADPNNWMTGVRESAFHKLQQEYKRLEDVKPAISEKLTFELCLDVVEAGNIGPALEFVADTNNGILTENKLKESLKEKKWGVKEDDTRIDFSKFDAREILQIFCGTFDLAAAKIRMGIL